MHPLPTTRPTSAPAPPRVFPAIPNELCQGVPHGSLQLWQHKSCLAPGLLSGINQSGIWSGPLIAAKESHRAILYCTAIVGPGRKHAKCHGRPGEQKVRGVVGGGRLEGSLHTPTLRLSPAHVPD